MSHATPLRAANIDITGADAVALYAAKRNGRNQVWPPSVDEAVAAIELDRRCHSIQGLAA